MRKDGQDMELREREMNVPKSMINYFAITVCLHLYVTKKTISLLGSKQEGKFRKEPILKRKQKLFDDKKHLKTPIRSLFGFRVAIDIFISIAQVKSIF